MKTFDRLVEQTLANYYNYKAGASSAVQSPKYTYTPGTAIPQNTTTPTYSTQQSQPVSNYNNYPAYRILASMGMYPGKQYNFWEMIRLWYKNNTQFTDSQIDSMLSKKQSASQQAGFVNRTATLGYPQNWSSGPLEMQGTTVRAYFDSNNNTLYINPKLSDPSQITHAVLHELLHSVQPKDMLDGSSSNDYLSYTAEPVELDTALGELNRIVATKFNKLIVPGNEKEAEKYIRWFTDMKNMDYSRIHDKASAMLLRAIQQGRTTDEQNRIIKELAKRMVFLTGNTKPISNIA